eukprot:gene24934-biopygen16463
MVFLRARDTPGREGGGRPSQHAGFETLVSESKLAIPCPACAALAAGPGGTGHWRGRGAGYRLQFGMSGAGVARAWRGHVMFPLPLSGGETTILCSFSDCGKIWESSIIWQFQNDGGNDGKDGDPHQFPSFPLIISGRAGRPAPAGPGGSPNQPLRTFQAPNGGNEYRVVVGGGRPQQAPGGSPNQPQRAFQAPNGGNEYRLIRRP